MGRNDINLDQINSRLGGMNKRSSYSNYDGDQSEDFGQDVVDQSSSFSAGYLATIFAGFVAVSSGTFMITDGFNPLKNLNVMAMVSGLPSGFKSRADLACGGAWNKGARNDTAMMCYLTTDVDRLCDSNERKHLAGLVTQYRVDRKTAETGKMAADFKSIGSLSGVFKDMNKSFERAMQNDNEGASSININEQVQQSRNYKSAMQDFSKSTNKLSQTFSGGWFGKKTGAGSAAPDGKISMAIHKLGVDGYMTRWDFGIWPDVIVREGFTNMVDYPANNCKS